MPDQSAKVSVAGGIARELLVPKPAPVPWDRAVAAACMITAPIGIGIAANRAADGLLISMGTLPALISDRGGPHRLRAQRIALTVMASGLGFLVGAAVRGEGWVAVVVVTAVALGSGVVSGIGAKSSVMSLNFLIYCTIASLRAFPGAIWWSPLLVLIGGTATLALTLVSWTRRRGAPEREAVARVYERLADLVDATGTPEFEPRRLSLTLALNEAEDAVLAGRLSNGGHDAAWWRLLSILNASGPLIDAVYILNRQCHNTADQHLGDSLRALAQAVRTRSEFPASAWSPPTGVGGQTGVPTVEPIAAWSAAWHRSVDAIAAAEHGEGRTPAGLPQPWGRRLRAVLEGPLSSPAVWVSAVRLTLCVGLAEALRSIVIQDRSYWIVLTVAVVMKPDFGSVFARAVQRTLGTSVGVVLGGVVMTVIPGQSALLPFIALFAFLLPVMLGRNYALFAVFLTPLVLIQIDALSPAPRHLVWDRLLDTLLGSGIVLLVGYLLWPGTWRPATARRFAEAANAVAGYLRVAFAGDPADTERRAAAGLCRRAAFRRLSDLRTTFQQSFAEPGAARRDAESLWPAAMALERFCEQVAAIVAHRAVGADRPDPADVQRTEVAIRQLSAAALARRPPAPFDLPTAGPLADPAQELARARDALRRWDRRRLSVPRPRSISSF